MGSYAFNDLGSHFQGLDGTQPQSLQARNVFKNPYDKAVERGTQLQISSVGSKMDPRKDNLLVAAIHQCCDFLQDRSDRQATASSSNRRNDAERAVRIAPILDFNDGPGPSPGTQVRLGSEF